MTEKRQIKDVHALTRLYDLILWIVPVLEKFPKSQKFLMADRIQSMLLDVLELIVQAIYTRNKTQLLYDANLKIETLRHLVRLSKDLKLLSINKYEYISKSLNDVGAEVGGWLKFARTQK